MNFGLIVIWSSVALVSTLEQERFSIPAESLAKLHKVATPCAEKYNLDIEIIRHIGEPTLSRDEATNNFLYCYSVNSGIIKEDGHLVPERLTGVVGDHPLKDRLREALTKCNDITKENPVATVVAMHLSRHNDDFPLQGCLEEIAD